MANTKSAQKRIRANQKRADRNRTYRSRLKTLVKKAEGQIENTVAKAPLKGVISTPQDPAVTAAAVREAMRTLDKAANKGIIHPNNAARRKSRLAKKLRLATA